MLFKTTTTTIIPATPGDPGQPHTHQCTVVSPPGPDAPPDSGGDDSGNPFAQYCRECLVSPGRFITFCWPTQDFDCP